MSYISAVFCLLLLLLAVIFLPSVFVSLHDVQVSTNTESTTLATGDGVTTGNITLSEGLFDDSIASVVSLASTNDNDNPYVISYNEGTLELQIGGLEASASRILSAEYEYLNPSNNSNLGRVVMFLSIAVALAFVVMLIVIPGGTIADIWARARG